MKKHLHKDPIPRPSTGTSDPAALAAQINAEAEQKPASGLLCPAFKPNHHVGGSWARPDDQQELAQILPAPYGHKIVKLYRYDADGVQIETLTGTGPTVRAAYADAHHQHRRARHSIEALHRQRRRALQRALVLRAGSRATLRIANEALAATSALRADTDTLKDELTKAGEVITRLEANLKQAQGRINELEHDGLEKDKGMALIRQAVNQAYPDTDALTLDKRIEGLGKERDSWQARALAAEVTNRAETRDSAHAAQRIQS
jgi:hypothetical protein